MKNKILFICPTNRWNTRERSLLYDIENAIDNDNEVLFYGLKGSPVDRRIDSNKVQKYYHPGLVQTHFFLWPKLIRLSALLEDPALNLVHCYKLNILWPICFFLRGNKKVSVVLSQFFELKKNYRGLWHRLLIKRCDLIFVPFEHLVKNLWSRIGVHPRRIEVRTPCLYMGSKESSGKAIFEKFEQFYSIGIYISEADKDVEALYPYLRALIVVNERFKWERPIKLVFVTEGSWNEKVVYLKLKQKILDEGIEEHIVFHSDDHPASYMHYFDLWMSLPSGEGLDDLSLLATSIGTPILAARHPSVVEFYTEYGKIGETYKASDVRDIVRKWELILSKSELYQDEIELAANKIKERYSHKAYKNQYVSSIQKIVARRERYGLRKAK